MSQDKKKGDKDELLKRARAHVHERFDARLAPKYLFHNFAYSSEIEGALDDLMEKTELDENTQFLLRIVALFYPLGYINGHKKFQDTSVEELKAWAGAEGLDLSSPDGTAADWLKAVKNADQDSLLPVRILHDACWSWLGRKRFDRRSNLLQLERDAIASKEGDPIKFGEEMQNLLLNFNYLTSVGKRKYDKRRRKNVSSQQSDNYKIEQKEVKARTGKNFGRGIDTMYRTAFRNHINLSRIADGKANMMISINTIILSIVITVSGASLSFFEDVFFENPEFLVPIISLLLSSLIAVIFAVFSARPSVTEYRIKKDKLIKSKEASLLYFGNFLKLEKKEFIEYMATMKLDQNALYDDLAKDLYDLGQVMHKKYLLLTISYNTFVGGLALAVLSFLTVYLLNIL
ncbi:Pycsar system effector family protein [Neolewinella persica]|uniref:Pycsar system effector family protein n=1 Tax=Neolewinella persica TaxID=70998 RepID=UPI000375D92B|nr:Pycsar system effector family protein [Neolewinella persica]